ncbi:MAG: NAD(P)/FAD-dependent oxidoreductase [Bacteroidia bacterium]|nr:NAD(P)/FAD-dependent oxidoreductase [Bacteroidia bacterium]NND11780.1 NAD(P)/FAD-dependent oxidoreductase [Flavobacteriaceae bacterium]MBT8310359.1 NAD(P)/FAD-dependent oxidoreductase [Bacteroidia bacterium]NNK27005.1 NAD(P)/FAD-dependent oxidoreductase [Flavobacteriaceae bacterium]NNL61771.1 NAD(P)/FAD-dependent oxidoreductase [Flavobacteriaceae bacterium]
MIRADVVVIGGGAAGFFAAINISEKNPDLKVIILERGKDVLTKVKVSGGGRCNVTHAEFDPSELVKNYPRGGKELLGPFHQFMTGDTIEWFEKRGIELKIEEDGRMFPISDSSQTIIDCFLSEIQHYGIELLKQQAVREVIKQKSSWLVKTDKSEFIADNLVITTGSNPKMWKLLEGLGHTIVPPVPSLFTFNIKDQRINNIPGVVAKDVEVTVFGTDLSSEGPILITHWGMSAPAILKLSAFGAIELAKLDYTFDIKVNFVMRTFHECMAQLKIYKQDHAKKKVFKSAQFELPKRLWQQLVRAAGLKEDLRWADMNKKNLEDLSFQLTEAVFNVDGKSTFKEEFVTAGGIDLKEVNFKTFASRLHENLYFAGEILNIDAVTGGFNFQNAWTGAYIAAKTISL